MRLDTRSSLTVQLIQEADFGPGRFEPQGPRLRLTSAESVRPAVDESVAAAPMDAFHPVDAKPDARPADTYRCDGRLAGPCPHVTYAASPAEVHVTRVIETTVLPSHLAGALLDVLA